MPTISSAELGVLSSQKLNKRGIKSQTMRAEGRVTTSGATTIDSVLVFHRIPVDAIIKDVLVSSTDHGTTGLMHVGLYPALMNKAKDGSDLLIADAVDADALAVAMDIKTAAFSKTNVRFSALALTSNNKKAWELATGLTARPTTYNEFFVVGTLSEATTVAGSVVVETVYSV